MTVFDLESYLCTRKTLALTGRISVHDASGALVAYSKQKALKLREDIGVFTDESESTPLFFIKARQIFDFGATFDVRMADGTPAGALRRKALKSMLKDEYLVLGTGDREEGAIVEDSTGLAIVRRFVPFMALFLAQGYSMTLGGRAAAMFKRNQNPFISRLSAKLEPGLERNQRVMILAAAVLLLIVEGKEG